MKKVANVFEEKAEGLDSNKRLTKNVSENIHRVDSIVSSARSSSSLFNIQAISARFRLRDACERAILTGSSSFTQRMEEILWRKVYYEPLSTAKKMRKGSSWSDLEGGLIWTHLNDGIAYYHHHLMTLAFSANNAIQYTADLLPSYNHDIDPKNKANLAEVFLHDSFFRSLTCLGDLARYMLDIPSQISSSSAYLLSVRYYHQALHYNCEGGLTHSNLATVYSTNNQPLLAAVHYLRAMTCEKPFEAAENNLRRMLDKSRVWLENKKMEKESSSSSKEGSIEKESTRFLHTCLALISCFINNRRMEEVAVLCQEVLVQLGKLLDDYDNVEPPDLSEGSTELPSKALNGCIDPALAPKAPSSEAVGGVFLLTPESMVTLCGLFIICVKRLKMQGSPHSNMSEVLLISILLTLVSHINTRLEQRFSLVDPTFVLKLLPSQEQPAKTEEDAEKAKEKDDSGVCNGESKGKKSKARRNKLSKLRRRRTKPFGHMEEDSEPEENGAEEDSNESGPEGDVTSSSDEAEDDFDQSALCSSEDEDSDNDVKIECEEEEWEGVSEEEHLQLVEQEGMLAAVNVTLQWLAGNEDLIKMCGQTAHNLWTSTARLFNLVRLDYDQLCVEDVSSLKRDVLKGLSELGKGSWEGQDLGPWVSSLPETLMLHLVIPSFRRVGHAHSLKASEMNLVRLFRLNLIMFRLCKRADTPLRLMDQRYVSCEEKIKSIAEKAKLENEKATDGRVTPSNNVQQHLSSSSISTSQFSSTKPIAGDDPSHKGEDTPKRSGQPPISSRVASSMQSLTAQWLQHEVRHLEEKTSCRMRLGGLYLVPDASVLIHHLAAIKQMLSTPSHMVIIPQVVIDSLDQQKRESVGARDAIRWLELKLRHGSRFMRAQRPHEKTRLPLIKYPKRKDKDAWEWFHLAECCYYLGAQMNKSDPKTSTVTLLTTDTSNKLAKRSFSLHTLAEAAGATLQSVEEFVGKWQVSTKGHS